MLVKTLPDSFRVGDSIDSTINGKPKRLTWRDEKTLVIEPDGVCTILALGHDGVARRFVCTRPGESAEKYQGAVYSGAAGPWSA